MNPWVWGPVLVLFWSAGTLIVHRLVHASYARALRRGMTSGSTLESLQGPRAAADGAASVTLSRLPCEADPAIVRRFVGLRTRHVVIHLAAGGFLVVLLSWMILTIVDPIGFSAARVAGLALLLGAAALAQTLVTSFSRNGQLSSAGVWLLSATAGLLLGLVHVVVVNLALEPVGSGSIYWRMLLLLLQEAIALLAVGVVFWLLLQARQGVIKLLRFGPEPLAISTVWIVVALLTTTIWSHGQHGERAWLLVLPSFAYLVLLRAMFAAWTAPSGTPVAVLYLRTFGPGRRGERFLRRFSRWWSIQGPVRLITGEDTARSTLSSTAALALLTGRMNQLFVTNPEEAAASVRRQATGPTADGTFPVTELLCTAATWRSVVVELMRAVAVVVLDLRAYQPEHRGVVFEVNALAQEVDPARIIHVVDHATDVQAVDALLRQAWSRRAEPVNLKMYELPEDLEQAIEGLVTLASRVAREERIDGLERRHRSTIAP